MSLVGPGRVGSGRVGSGRVGSGQVGSAQVRLSRGGSSRGGLGRVGQEAISTPTPANRASYSMAECRWVFPSPQHESVS